MGGGPKVQSSWELSFSYFRWFFSFRTGGKMLAYWLKLHGATWFGLSSIQRRVGGLGVSHLKWPLRLRVQSWGNPNGGSQTGALNGEALKGLHLKGLLSKHRSIACPLPLALASDLPCGVCTCEWDLQLLSPRWLWTDFPRPRGWRVTTALGNPFPCGTALGNPFPCRRVCLAQKAPLDKPPLRLPKA